MSVAKLDYDSIIRMLTLRYDPKREPGKRPLQSIDFVPMHFEDIELKLISIIRDDLLHKKEELKFKEICLSLSSGIDSVLTLAMIRSILPDVKIECISMGFGDTDDEINKAEELSKLYECNFHSITNADILNELPKLINIVKEPRWNLYPYYIFEYGKQRFDNNIFFSGDGGDELLGGYVFRYHKFLSLTTPDIIRKEQWKEKVKLYLSCHERDWVPDQPDIFGRMINFSWEKIYTLFESYFNNNLSHLDQIFLADFNGKLLYDWLPQNKAFEESLHLNIYSIFLSDDMIKFATHIPWERKYNPSTGEGKIPLRVILSKYKGFEKVNTVKKGFSIDLMSLWERRNTQDIINRYIHSNSEIVKAQIISESWLKKVVNILKQSDQIDYQLKIRYISKMLSILALEIWYRLFISRSMTERQKL